MCNIKQKIKIIERDRAKHKKENVPMLVPVYGDDPIPELESGRKYFFYFLPDFFRPNFEVDQAPVPFKSRLKS